MKLFYSRFRIGLMTFALGLASVFMMNGSLQHSDEVKVILPKVESSSVIEIITDEKWEGFETVGHACGGRTKYGGESSSTGYRTSDMRLVSISTSSYNNARGAKREFNSRARDAANILEIDNKRVVLEYMEDEVNYYEIVFFTDRNSLGIINSRRLETAVEFENWEKTRN